MVGFSESYAWNQIEVIRNFILHFINERQIKSLLDIGAGSIATAIPYSQSVEYYLGVEQNNKRYNFLKKESANIIKGTWPINLNKTFDLVLSSHSIPEQQQNYNSFISTSWDHVKSGGYLMIITFKGGNNTFLQIAHQLVPINYFIKDENLYLNLLANLSRIGPYVTESIVSHEITNNAEDIAKSICRSLEMNFEIEKNKILNLLYDKFKKGNQYEFPHEHLVIILKKS